MGSARLIEIDWPDFGRGRRPAGPDVWEFVERLGATREAMQKRGLSHLVVYGDREHFSNLYYLCGLDPRFEEALLVMGMEHRPLLLVGNECLGYLSVSPLHVAGELRHELFQPLSLVSQPMDDSRSLRDIFVSEGIGADSSVGCVGWKYFAEPETIEIPAYLVDELRELAGRDAVVNASDVFMHPTTGLRSTISPTEIAYMEWTGTLASDGMKHMLFGLQEGMLDYDAVKLLDYCGEPLCCHVTLVTGQNRELGLSGPVGARLRRGEPFASNFGYWGSNICRAGWVAESARDLPAAAQDYVEAFAGPYFAAMNEWFERMKVGTTGGELFDAVHDNLDESFGISLNPGHLIHTEEWTSSPIYRGSEEPIRSGMALQVDVIPTSETYFSTRMEDGIVIADRGLQADLGRQHPDVLARCLSRRQFMRDTLGLELHDDVLPTSNICSIVPPFLLSTNLVFAMS